MTAQRSKGSGRGEDRLKALPGCWESERRKTVSDKRIVVLYQWGPQWRPPSPEQRTRRAWAPEKGAAPALLSVAALVSSHGSRCRPLKIAGLFFQRTNPINRYILLWISILRWVPGNEGPGWQQTLPTNCNLGLLEALKTAFLMNVAKQPQKLCLCTDSGPSDLQFQARIAKSESVSQATRQKLTTSAAFLSLWLTTPLGVQWPFHRGHISDNLYNRYLYYSSWQ